MDPEETLTKRGASQRTSLRKHAASNPFSQLFNFYVHRAGLLQKDLARKIGYTETYISMLKRGERPLSGPMLEKLAEELNLSLQERDLLMKAATQFTATSPQLNWGEAPHVNLFQGREEECCVLERWIVDDRCRVVAIVGIAGIGKTSLAAKVAEQLTKKFAYIFWRSLQNAPPPEHFLKTCLQFLSDQRTDLPEDVDSQISLLVEYLRTRRCLIVLDNIETVLEAGSQTGQYRKSYEGYGKLLQRLGEAEHNSCLLLTSREQPREVAHLQGAVSPVRSLDLFGVKQAEGMAIIQDKGLYGSDEAWEILIHRYAGNPLALKVVAESIREVFGGNIEEFLTEQEAVFGGIRDLLEQQFQRLSDLEKEIMYWLAIEREPVLLRDLQEDLLYTVQKGAVPEALEALRRRSMVERPTVETSGRAGFTLLPVIMEYVTDRLIEQAYEEISAEKISVLTSHALIKAQVKDYIRNTQERLIVSVLQERLQARFGKAETEQKLRRILSHLREINFQQQGYVAGNVLNLLIQSGCDLHGYDFSHLAVRQAYLQNITLSEVNFSHADLSKSVFTDAFRIVLSVALSSNGELLAAGTTSGEIRLWYADSGTPLSTFWGHADWVYSIAFSLDGKLLASGGEDQTVRLWEVSSGQCLKVLQGHTRRVYSVAFSPDGKLLASGGEDQTVRLWEVSSGQCLKVLQGHNDWVWSIAFSPNGEFLASGSEDQTVRLWEVSSGQCLKTLPGHTRRVRSVAFSPDGKLLASGGDETVKLWDPCAGELLRTLTEHAGYIVSIAFSLDGKLLASGSEDQTVRLWEASSGQCLSVLQGHNDWVWSVAFSPDGELLASGCDDQAVRLWEVSSGKCLKVLQGHNDRVRSVTFNPDGTVLVSGCGDGTIKLWMVQTGECLETLRSDRPYENTNITDVKGVTEAQKATLRLLGARED